MSVPPLADTHCHLDAAEFDHDRDAVWARARTSGVAWALVPAVDPRTWDATARCALRGERDVALGVHPVYLGQIPREALDAGLHALASRVREAGAVAVGECGFDGSTEALRASLPQQREVFAAHVEVARALDLPLVVHVLRAHGEALAAMRALRLPTRPGVIHSFSGSAELAREYVALGWHLGFGGAITRSTARRSLEALRATPEARVLLETDAPDQRPTGAEGEAGRCEPSHLAVVARRAAEVRGVTLDALAAVTTANARALFHMR